LFIKQHHLLSPLFSRCSLVVLSLFSRCSLVVLTLFSHSLVVLTLFSRCSPVLSLFSRCSYVLSLFLRSLVVLTLFSCCSLIVLRRAEFRSLRCFSRWRNIKEHRGIEMSVCSFLFLNPEFQMKDISDTHPSCQPLITPHTVMTVYARTHTHTHTRTRTHAHTDTHTHTQTHTDTHTHTQTHTHTHQAVGGRASV